MSFRKKTGNHHNFTMKNFWFNSNTWDDVGY
jgi:hypothetical protein